jgi:hypothetical protein
MVKAYGRSLLFFVGVSLSWLGGLAGGPVVDPVVDDVAPVRSIAYSAASLVGWVGLFVAGGWAVYVVGAPVGVLVGVLGALAWGFLVAPVVVVVAMRLLFPGISGRLQGQVDELGRARRTRVARRA